MATDEPYAAERPLHSARADPLGPETKNLSFIKDLSQGPGPEALEGLGPREEFPNEIKWLEGPGPGPSGLGREFSNEINGLGRATPGQPENGAPSGPVTGTPTPRARSGLLGEEPTPRARSGLLGPTPIEQKGAPRKPTRVPAPAGGNEKRAPTPGEKGTSPPGGSEKGAPALSEEGTVYPRWEDLF